ncbi:Na+/H+ antiporter NhaA [Agrococcus sp. SGAir0287]|uniref:Na+/H+ antiporter NhaA n=1 Tax=Agrococcus sp. SGAir0287 TaxID=2070347 RepID=UPI0010CD0A7B|nr:Na+/H+ antiporter NhaA [Agrococcus sp. SGAir0287]QCR19347.1 sodium:proton antiporter [Agrococcus sp. SGAir0287]
MTWIRNSQVAAALLLAAAVIGLVVANTPLGPGLDDLKHWHPTPFGGVDLSAAHWVTDGLLAVFFLVAAIELRYELTQGELADRRKALVPAIAAVGGVVAPALLFVALVPRELAGGWPIPTATDIAFALGVLAIVGKRLPVAVRALLLALAVIDDLIAIGLIAILFTTSLQVWALVAAAATVVVVWALGRAYRTRRGSWPLRIAIAAACIALWWLVLQSGVHATIAGVAAGLVLAPAPAEAARHRLEPIVNGAILPLFAFVSASVMIPQVPLGALSPIFLAIAIALPVGKLVGITLAGWLGQIALRTPKADRLGLGDLVTVALLGGIGFTVSLLMNELAHRSAEELIVDGTLGVLVGSLVAVLVGGTVTAIRSARRAPDDDDDRAARRAADDAEYSRRYDGE